MKTFDQQDTIVALATPSGVGAIGVIRVSGAGAIELVNKIFSKDISQAGGYSLHYGYIRDEEKTLDEVIISLFRAPHSYTGENSIEISCHGSPYILEQVIHLLIDKGARMADAGEFTMRAFLNGKMDLSQAEAVADLIASDSAKSHEVALKQMRGGFSDEIKKLREELVHFASMIELELDFSEEDVEFADRDKLITLIDSIAKLVQGLLDSFRLGNVIKNGVATVIAGRPNAGKSTLLNALLNEERAIVSDIPGTTRDTIEEVLNINGIQFRLIDTAGIRDATDRIEAIGVEKTMEKLKQAALYVYLFDVNELSPDELQADLNKLDTDSVPRLVAGNKIDLSQNYEQQFAKAGDILFISSLEKDKVHELREALYNTALQQQVNTSGTIVTNARHYQALSGAATSLQDVRNGIELGVSGELLALDIKRALQFLGEITGEVTTDDLLGNIFSKFCIGK